MKKRFVVALNSSTVEQDRQFVEWLHGPYGYWHWLKNLWLISDSAGVLTAADIRTKTNEIYGNVHKLVLELRSDGTDTWSGLGSGSAERNMFKWIHENWKK